LQKFSPPSRLNARGYRNRGSEPEISPFVKEKTMPNSAATIGVRVPDNAGNIAWSYRTDRLPSHRPVTRTERALPLEEPLRHDADSSIAARNLATELRYGHRPAVVVSRSRALRKSLQQALVARGAAVVNLRALPSSRHLEDLLTSGLIVLAPPDRRQQTDPSDWIDAPEAPSISQSVSATLHNLERRGVLDSRDLVFPGEGI